MHAVLACYVLSFGQHYMPLPACNLCNCATVQLCNAEVHPQVEGNPCLAYIRLIILPWFGKFEVQRGEAQGGNR